MPITYDINPGERLLVVRATGTIGDVEMLACIVRVREDDRFNVELDQLCDYRAVTSTGGLTIEFLRECTQRWPLAAGARRAYVAQSEDTLPILRVMEALTSRVSNEVRVFPALDDALSWLGRPAAALLPAAALEGGTRHQTGRQRRESRERDRRDHWQPTTGDRQRADAPLDVGSLLEAVEGHWSSVAGRR